MRRARSYVIIVILSIFAYNGRVMCWKPISGPPTSFSITQSHPPVGSSSSHIHTNVVDAATDTVDAYSLSDKSFLSNYEHTGDGGLLDDGDPSYKIGPESRFFSSSGFGEDTCSVDKYAFDHEGTIKYQHQMPKLEQFTLCLWMRFTNHSGDHVLFTYSIDEEPREIQFWVANAKSSSFISMAVHGQSLYRLNYPLKLRVWHHACSSWNGKTGEWQLWVKAERVGRGFHNRLVNHVVKSNGITYSGGHSITGPIPYGLHNELTMVQLYKVALSAGKAHRDHKHHHVHHFDHNGPIMLTTPAPLQRVAPALPSNPLLANGQIPTRVRINLAQPNNQQQQQQQQPAPLGLPESILNGLIPAIPAQQNEATITTNFANGQYHTAGRLLSQQLLAAARPQLPTASTVSFPLSATVSLPDTQSFTSFAGSPANVKYLNSDNSGGRFFFKRDDTAGTLTKGETVKEKRDISTKETKVNKRGLVKLGDGFVVDDSLLAHGYSFDGLAQFGLPSFKQNLQKQMDIEDEIREHDKEPAEGEVQAVMNLCTACDDEPFQGAITIAWKHLRMTQLHTLRGRSVGGCGHF